MLTTYVKPPGVWFGGKTHAASLVWKLLGDVEHYVSPFCGMLGIELQRPHLANRPYHSETVGDSNGLLVNALRAIQLQPQATAEACSCFYTEADLHARHLALVHWLATEPLEHLMGDPMWCHPTMAGYWLYGLALWIGGGWCFEQGPWTRDPGTGRMIHTHDRASPGVTRKRPHVSNNGQGVQHAGLREPGVIGPPSRGHDPTDDVEALITADYAATEGYHPMTMPELRRWFAWLSARLRHMRIINEDYRRLLKDGVLKTLSVWEKGGVCGVFLDPPYSAAVRDKRIYTSDVTEPTRDLAGEVRDWCLAHGDDPALRIILCGFTDEGHEVLEAHGWQCHAWYMDGYLRGGYGHQSAAGPQQHRERLWASPHCLNPTGEDTRQLQLW